MYANAQMIDTDCVFREEAKCSGVKPKIGSWYPRDKSGFRQISRTEEWYENSIDVLDGSFPDSAVTQFAI
jgi:hypothetical protein